MTEPLSRYTRLLDRLAPLRLAQDGDNVGLQIGSPNWPVKKIGVALDPLPEVVAEACAQGVGLLVTHHPLFFRPVQRILTDTAQGSVVETALAHKMGLYCAHTNLDSVAGGVNDVLSDRLELEHRRVLKATGETGLHKLVVFVPLDHVRAMFETILALGVGRIGRYSCCTFRSEGVGTFLPDDEASPAIGKTGNLNEVRESRIEMIVPRADLQSVVAALSKAHPYETMAYDVYPDYVEEAEAGLGRVGELQAPQPLSSFCDQVKRALNCATLTVVGEDQRRIETVAVCSGSGSSLLPAAVASGAQAYVSGDLTYHAARDAQAAGICLVDVGHFASEHLIVEALVNKLQQQIKKQGHAATVVAVGKETDPFRRV